MASVQEIKIPAAPSSSAATSTTASTADTSNASSSTSSAETASETLLHEVSTLSYKNGTTRLRMSRSIGDFYLKQNDALDIDKQAVTAVPEIVIHSRSAR
jgi:hypothetical protein